MNLIAFLDIMGWSQLIKKNNSFAIDLLLNYSNQIKFNSDYMTDRLNSFLNFIPMSDSIIITSIDGDKFCSQISYFLFSCFEYSIKQDEARKFGQLNSKEILSAYPLLFRGGVSVEDFTLYQTLIIKDGNLEIQGNTNVTGMGMVNAVGLENSEAKGPRVFVEKKFVQELSQNSKIHYIDEYETDKFEILWPIDILLKDQGSNSENQALSYFLKMYLPAEKMLNYFKADPKVELHYNEFISLIDRSLMKYFNGRDDGSPGVLKYESLKESYDRL
ncbi:hypothetical protein [Leptospira alstonii]|uniref:hypothetical protein n=1 Tax=Leptospira alstonii TaxID=28452 RepID=UPI000774CC5C|nr:hypothetical protein [Leptospira alstonii]